MISFILYIVTLAIALAIGYIGLDFSPSFTAMFLVAFLVLTTLSELCNHFEKKRNNRALAFLTHFSPAIGGLFVLVSAYMYANGDDWLGICVRVAPVVAAILHIAIYIFLYRRKNRKMGIGAAIENWLLLAAGLFTVFCAVPSTALWPYGLGVLLILAAKRLADVKDGETLPRVATVLGMLLCAVFLVAPMVF